MKNNFGSIKGIELSESQINTIDSLLSTHRELSSCEVVDFNIHGMAKGGKVINIHSGEYWYGYKILKSGAIVETRKSENNISYSKLKYYDI